MGLSDDLSHLDRDFAFFGKNIEKLCCALLIALHQGCMVSPCLVTGDVHVDPLTRVLYARSLHCEVTVSSFVTLKYLVGRYFETMEKPCFFFFSPSIKSLFFKLNFYFYFILLYNTVLVLPYIDMNPPRVHMSSES